MTRRPQHRARHALASICTACVAVASLMIGSGSAQAADNLLANGSFENGPSGLGSFASWTTRIDDGYTFVDSTGQTGRLFDQATDGRWFAVFGSAPANGGSAISQSFATAVGGSYRVAFDLAVGPASVASTDNRFDVSVTGSTLLSLSNLTAQNYVHYEAAFVATTSSTTLRFEGFNAAGFTELDAASVSAVPEPTSAALLLAGTAALCLRRPRRTV